MILSIIMKFIITIKKIAFSVIMKFITMTKKMTFSMDVVKKESIQCGANAVSL